MPPFGLLGLIKQAVQGFADREQTDCHQHHLDAIHQFGHAQGVAGNARRRVEADHADGQADPQ
ncbi:hypothetical protein D3C85_1554480 [compost metagenome]